MQHWQSWCRTVLKSQGWSQGCLGDQEESDGCLEEKVRGKSRGRGFPETQPASAWLALGCIHISRCDGPGETVWERNSPPLNAALGSYLRAFDSKALPVLLAEEPLGPVDTSTHPGVGSGMDQRREVLAVRGQGWSCRLVPRKAQPGHTVLFAGSPLRELLPYAALCSASSQRLLEGRGTNKRGNNAFQEPRTSSGSPGVRAANAAETLCAGCGASWSGEHPAQPSCQWFW